MFDRYNFPARSRKRRTHLRIDESEAYCGLRLVHEYYLVDSINDATCPRCIERYHFDGHPTPRITVADTPVVPIEELREIDELDAYLRDIRKHRK